MPVTGAPWLSVSRIFWKISLSRRPVDSFDASLDDSSEYGAARVFAGPNATGVESNGPSLRPELIFQIVQSF